MYIIKDNPGGIERIISNQYEEILLLYLEERPQAHLDEIAWFMFDEFDVATDESTVWRALKRLGWSTKVARFTA